MSKIKGMRILDGSSELPVKKILPERRNLGKKINNQKTIGRIVWLDVFKKKLNTREAQTVASCNGSFVVPDRDGYEPQFLMPHPCLCPQSKPLFTTRYFGDIYIIKALKFEVEERHVNGTKLVVIDSEVSIGYNKAKENKVLLMFRDDECHFVWIEDEKKRMFVLSALNHAERIAQNTKNSWTHRYNSGILKPPEYSLSKNEITEIVSDVFDKSLNQLIEEAGAVIVQKNGQKIITMGIA